jgi:hypothetical protein
MANIHGIQGIQDVQGIPAIWRKLLAAVAGCEDQLLYLHAMVWNGSGLSGASVQLQDLRQYTIVTDAEYDVLSHVPDPCIDPRWAQHRFYPVQFAITSLTVGPKGFASLPELRRRFQDLCIYDESTVSGIAADGIENVGWERCVRGLGMRWMRVHAAARTIQLAYRAARQRRASPRAQ